MRRKMLKYISVSFLALNMFALRRLHFLQLTGSASAFSARENHLKGYGEKGLEE